jgi:uncharacterized membrane protein YhaH (DUF805 family)
MSDGWNQGDGQGWGQGQIGGQGQVGAPAPGWYYAQGDPPGTQRYWDGVQWVGEPQGAGQQAPAQSGFEFDQQPPYSAGPAGFSGQAGYGLVDARRQPRPDPENPFGWWKLYWSRFTDIGGRACRAEYWWGTLLNGLGFAVLYIALLVVFGTSDSGDGGASAVGITIAILFFVFWIVVTVGSISATARRLHDSGKSGWFQLLSLLPLLSFVVLIFTLLPSDAGANKYGLPQ